MVAQLDGLNADVCKNPSTSGAAPHHMITPKSHFIIPTLMLWTILSYNECDRSFNIIKWNFVIGQTHSFNGTLQSFQSVISNFLSV